MFCFQKVTVQSFPHQIVGTKPDRAVSCLDQCSSTYLHFLLEAGAQKRREQNRGWQLSSSSLLPARLHGLRTAREIHVTTFVFFFHALIAMFRPNKGA